MGTLLPWPYKAWLDVELVKRTIPLPKLQFSAAIVIVSDQQSRLTYDCGNSLLVGPGQVVNKAWWYFD